MAFTESELARRARAHVSEKNANGHYETISLGQGFLDGWREHEAKAQPLLDAVRALRTLSVEPSRAADWEAQWIGAETAVFAALLEYETPSDQTTGATT